MSSISQIDDSQKFENPTDLPPRNNREGRQLNHSDWLKKSAGNKWNRKVEKNPNNNNK